MELVTQTASDVSAHIEISAGQIKLYPDSRRIYHPHFVTVDKMRIKAIVRRPDGQLTEQEADRRDKNSALIRDVFAQYSEAEIEMYSHRESCLAEREREIQTRLQDDKRINEERELIFQAKAKALEIPEVQTCPDANLVRKIRRAKSLVEVNAWTTIAMTATVAAADSSAKHV